MAGSSGFDDAATAMVVTRDDLLFAVRCAPCGVAAKGHGLVSHALVVSAVRHAILPHIARRAMAQRPLGDDARGVMPGRALDQLDVMFFLRGRLLGHVDRAATEHCAARGRCHQLHHRCANRHSLRSFVSAAGIKQRELPLPFHSPCRCRNADETGADNPVNRVSRLGIVPKPRKTGSLRNSVPKWNRIFANRDC